MYRLLKRSVNMSAGESNILKYWRQKIKSPER